MKYKIFRTNSFKRDFKKLNSEEKEIFRDILIKLANGEKLENKYKDHNLRGNWNGCRECHLKPYLLLIYKINNHSSIFKQ